MNDMVKITQDFCAECLGWDDAEVVNDWGHVYARRKSAHTQKAIPGNREKFLHPSNLSELAKTIEAWVDRNEHVVEEVYRNGAYGARIVRCREMNRDKFEWQIGSRKDEALMAACIMAARKLKEQAA